MGVLLAGGLTGLLNQSSAQVIDGSLKFDKTSSTYLTRTPASAGNRKVWTLSYWIKLSGDGGHLFSANNDGFQLEYRNDNFLLFANSGSTSGNTSSTAVFRDPSAFYHIVVQHDAVNTISRFYINGTLNFTATLSNADGTWNNNTSHNINGRSTSNDSYSSFAMSQVNFIDGLALGPDSFGFTDPLTGVWRPKKFTTGGTTVNNGTTWSSNFSGNGGTQPTNAFNGTGPKQNGYVHSGSELTVNFPSPGLSGRIVVYGGTGFGNHNATGIDTFTLSDGSVLSSSEKYDVAPYWTAMDFGEKNNITSLVCSAGYTLYAVSVDGVILEDSVTNPTIAYGTNGFYLPMDNDDFNIDKSGNGNNWTKQNFSGTSNDPDVLKDSPSGAVSGGRAQTGITTTSSAPSNYATLNPLQMSPNRTPTISDGNLSISLSSGSSEWTNTGCTMNIGSGKYYWEVQFTTINGTIARIGVADSNDYGFNNNTASSGLPWLGSSSGISWSLDVGGNTYYNGSTVNASYTSTIITSDIIGVLLDLDNNTLSYSKNGTNLGVAHSNVTSDFVTPGFGLHGATTNTINVNFGQKPFKYAPPQGYLPLNSASATPETVIVRPDKYVGATLYTGNNGTQNINAGLKPDFVWIKNRSSSATDGNHLLFDTIRGVQNAIYSNLTDDQDTLSNSLTSFNSDGFTVGGPGASGNIDSQNYVAWTWKAGGNKNTFNKDDVGYASAADAGFATGGSNITPTGASVGTKQGFSIVTWDVGSLNGTLSLDTGLTKAPDFVITKVLDHNDDWLTFHKDLSSTESLILNGTRAKASNAAYAHTFNSNGTISGLVVPNWWIANKSYVFYSWHNVPGLQKFGKYTANNSSDGVFVELGFKPKILLIKNYDSTGDWIIWDSARNPVNPVNRQIWPYTTSGTYGAYDQVGADYPLDFLSNGFKMRTTDADMNGSSRNYIYAAWAEAPTFNLYGGQSNAR